MPALPRLVRLVRSAAVALVVVSGALGPGAVIAPDIFSQPAKALGSGNQIILGLGFDTMCAPTVAQMQTLWSNSPWFTAGVYIGGVNIACKQNNNLNAAWLNSTHSQGWDFNFFWVGEQATCTPPGYFWIMSSNGTIANEQGTSNASSAWQKLTNTLGVANGAAGTPVTYDMESYGQPSWTSPCQLRVNDFMTGWTASLHNSPPQLSGYYGSTCGSNVDAQFGISPRVDFIHGANYDNNPNPNVMACVNSGHWANNQRFKQYKANVSASNYGVNILVDYDCSHGPSAPGGTLITANC